MTTIEDAERIVRSATEFLRAHFGAAFDTCVATGIFGSLARGELRETSDIDYCVAFDVRAAAGDECLMASSMSESIEAMTRHVSNVHSGLALAARFSVFWTTLQCLQEAQYGVGRWGPYDREAFRDHGKWIAGKSTPPSTLPAVSRKVLVADSAGFLLDVLRPKVKLAGLLDPARRFTIEELAHIGPVVMSKAVLMPVRLLYLLQPAAEQRTIVGTESAVEACARTHASCAWWPLVEMALRWRCSAPRSPESLEMASSLFRAHFVPLYAFCASAYAEALDQMADGAAAQCLRDWSHDLDGLLRRAH
jgi:predicted nucleotidyltransferase